MKPARSCERMTRLLSVSLANAVARLMVSSLVSSDVTTSTRRSTGTGLKKWMPMTWLGRCVAMASFMIGIDDVFDANTASSPVTTASSRRKMSSLADSASMTASTTRSRSASASKSLVNVRKLSARSCAASSSLPERTARASEASVRFWARSEDGASASTTIVSRPALAPTSAIPEPIKPPPTTPKRWNVICPVCQRRKVAGVLRIGSGGS